MKRIVILLSAILFGFGDLFAQNESLPNANSQDNDNINYLDKPGALIVYKYYDIGEVKEGVEKAGFTAIIAEDLGAREKEYFLRITTIGFKGEAAIGTCLLRLSDIEECAQAITYMNSQTPTPPKELIDITFSTDNNVGFSCFAIDDKRGGYKWICRITPDKKYNPRRFCTFSPQAYNDVLLNLQKAYEFLQQQNENNKL